LRWQQAKMKKHFPLFILVLFFGSACINPIQEEELLTDPVVTSVVLNYSQLNKSLFIAASVTDPQGRSNIDSVAFQLYFKDSVSATTKALFLENCLVDSGLPDIIWKDNIYSYLLDSTVMADREGYFTVEVQAFDKDGHTSDIESQSVMAKPNDEPILFPITIPESFEKGDTLIFMIRVTDPQGSDEISYDGAVSYVVKRPDGEYFSDPTLYLSDTGTRGDEISGDGIFTVHQPSNRNSKYQGLFYFYFTAKDIHGAVSDSLICPVRNPGVTLTAPNQADTLHAGESYRIEWESAYISNVVIEYASDAQMTSPTWRNVATVTASEYYYDWIAPAGVSSSHCMIKIYDADSQYPNRFDYSDNEFTILP
jgi:hypothetical protein